MLAKPAVYIFLGTLAIVTGVIVAFAIVDPRLSDGIKENVVIESDTEDNFRYFLSNQNPDDLPQDMQYWFWNLTNVDEVVAGEEAKFEKLGPFIFERVFEKIDYEFSDDGEEISYLMKYQHRAVLDDERNAGNPFETLITNVNPGYTATLAEAETESNILYPLAGPVLNETMALLADLTLMYTAPSLLATTYASIVDLLTPPESCDAEAELGCVNDAYFCFQGDRCSCHQDLIACVQAAACSTNTYVANCQADEAGCSAEQCSVAAGGGAEILDEVLDEFLATWANTTIAWAPVLTNYLPSLVGCNDDLECEPTEISMEAARTLFNASSPYSFISVSDTGRNTIYKWLNLEDFGEFRDGLRNVVGLTDEQTKTVSAWLREFVDLRVWPFVVHELAVAAEDPVEIFRKTDLGVLQSATLGPCENRAVTEVFVDAGLPSRVEYQVPGDEINVISFEAMQYALYDETVGVTSATAMPEYLRLAQAAFGDGFDEDSIAVLVSIWGIECGFFADPPTPCPALFLTTYLTDAIVEDFTTVRYGEIDKEGGGLFTTRTVYDWLFNAMDPLLLEIRPAAADVSFFVDHASNQEVRDDIAKRGINTVYTGVGSYEDVGAFSRYEGKSEVEWANGHVEKVQGTFADTFYPKLERNDDHLVWAFDIARVVNMEPSGATPTIRSIPTDRYVYPESLLDVDAKFYQNIKGFANTTHLRSGSPIYISNADMYGADPEYTAPLIATGSINPEDGKSRFTYSDVEPNTGYALRVHKVAQINMYLVGEDEQPDYLDGQNKDVIRDRMFPVVLIDGGGEISKDRAQFLRRTVIRIKNVRDDTLISCSVIGSLFVLGGVSYFFYRKRRSDYVQF